MSPEVIAAIIAASVSVLTVIGALAAQHFGRPATSRNTQEALGEQRKQLDRTLIRLPKRPLFGRRGRSNGSTSARRLGLHHRLRATPDHHRRLGACRGVAAPHIGRSLRSSRPRRVMLDTTRPSPDSVAA